MSVDFAINRSILPVTSAVDLQDKVLGKNSVSLLSQKNTVKSMSRTSHTR